MKRIIALLVVVMIGVLTAACGPLDFKVVKSGVLVDRLYSVEERRAGVAVVWLEHDEFGSYCFEPAVATREELESFLLSREEYTIRYISSRFREGSPCYWTGSTEGTYDFTTYIATGIEPAGGSRGGN